MLVAKSCSATLAQVRLLEINSEQAREFYCIGPMRDVGPTVKRVENDLFLDSQVLTEHNWMRTGLIWRCSDAILRPIFFWGVTYTNKIHVLRPGMYPLDYPLNCNDLAKQTLHPATNFEQAVLVAGQDQRILAEISGYSMFNIGNKKRWIHPSATGVMALFSENKIEYRCSRDTDSLATLPSGQYPMEWIGPNQQNLNRFIKLLGIERLKFDTAAQAQQSCRHTRVR